MHGESPHARAHFNLVHPLRLYARATRVSCIVPRCCGAVGLRGGWYFYRGGAHGFKQQRDVSHAVPVTCGRVVIARSARKVPYVWRSGGGVARC